MREYVLTKIMQRPKTNIFTIIILILGYIVTSFLLSFFVVKLFAVERLNFLIYIGVYIVVGLISSNFIAIKAVECYQHYAKEETRRRCMCKPTCSEYAIAVLKKHFILIALRKIKVRLFSTCKSGNYKIDMP